MKEIELTQGYKAIVDDEDFEYLNQFKWRAKVTEYTVYAVRANQGIRMHREILNAPDELSVDHLDLNGLNNTRGNLRVCTNGENLQNRRIALPNAKSKYRGVSVRMQSPKRKAKGQKHKPSFIAKIKINKKTICLGTFENEVDAAKTYNEAAKEYYGEFAKLNKL